MTQQTLTTAAPAAQTLPPGHRSRDTGPREADRAAPRRARRREALVAEELLVEEVSIDGMCGVY